MKKKIFYIITCVLILCTLTITSFANAIEKTPDGTALPVDSFRPKLFNVFNVEFDTYNRNLVIDNTLNYANYANGNITNTVIDEQIFIYDNYVQELEDNVVYGIENSNQLNNISYGDQFWQAGYKIETEYKGDQDLTGIEVRKKYIVIQDFYMWDDETFEFDDGIITDNSEIYITLNNTNNGKLSTATFFYRNVDTQVLQNQTITAGSNDNFTELFLHPYASMLEGVNDKKLIYVDKLIIEIEDEDPLSSAKNKLRYNVGVVTSDLIDDYANSIRGTGGNPAIDLAPFTKSLASAVAGFFDFEIFPNFNLGGILITIIAFACVVWWLKLVAGG